MKIELIKKLPSEGAIVFVVKEQFDGLTAKGNPVRTCPFFKILTEENKKYLESASAALSLNGSSAKLLILPSGRKALLIGVPGRGKFNNRKAILAARRVITAAKSEKIKRFAVSLDDFRARTSPQDAASMLGTQLEMANFEFVKYKTTPKEGWNFVEHADVVSKSGAQSVRRALEAGRIIGEEVNAARTLSNIPGGDMTPQKLAEAAADAGKKYGFKVTVFDEKKIADIGMGGVLGVSKGSLEKPRFIVLEYMRGRKTEKPVVLVGKGVTFDTGGLNLKPEQGIYEMHMDMSGGAAVIHTIEALARLKAKKNVIGLIPAVENMPSGSSYRPGDVLKTMSGKTIEVMNTDAEGRIILADALEYAKRFSPELVIDIATLTGSAIVALGQRATALFSTSAQAERALRAMGEATGDFVWPLPLWEEYENDVKGTFGDVANVGKNRYGGAINGAVFLRQFVRNTDGKDAYPWVHLDIAPRMTTVEGEFLAKGAAGASIALLIHFLKGY
ncbi:MAG: leucyl aminopeptidase family protein [Candidatus Liptonbacteria bacterium]|nr:leucyl aminopeptidase family protein [Candidatus Liptonbacteria bacterium]